ncbi:Serine threonine-protein kinase [Musa troglodytarum]|uniref:non-specific serine/threonine protein kinase n=1 Tax=Musa troglodytarum TaxID=320322 RepID=A0A9E7FL46_9LILI|nr:Serine threonine-protein kinase [Musa troglodytarum]
MTSRFFLVCLLGTTLISLTTGGDILSPDQSLTDDGQTLISTGGTFQLGFFGSDKRYVGIWYSKVSVRTVVWVANRRQPITGTSGSLSIKTNGTLVITDENATVVWSSSSRGLASPVAQLLDNGNFVVRESGSNGNDRNGFAWQSFDFPTDTLLPGMKLGWNLTSGLNRNLTAWTSDSDPAPSEFTMAMDVRGYPEVFLWSRSTRTWRSGPWNGLRFSGIPEMKTYNQLSFDFVVNRDEVFYSFYVHDASFITRLIVNQSGITQRLVWIEQSKIWNAFWFAPKDECDKVSQCGPNGVCDPNESPICDCLKGFRPKNPSNWALRDASDGCRRKTELDCRNGTDGFVPVSGVKLPDTSSSVANMSLSLEQCRTMCLTNCSCTAYAAANISASGTGSGCIMWTTELTDLRVYTNGGQDLYLRLAAADLGMSGNVSFSERHINEGREGKDIDLPLFDLGTIIDATNNFSVHSKLGEGGFGPVYKGKLGEEQEIAVKRLSKTSVQGPDEFKNEVMLIAKLQHRNLVRLLGCCIQDEERMLIYEYMPNRSLDAVLFDQAKVGLLDWRTRYNIIVGIARGLLYLHQDSRFRIIHRDMKAGNVLLDKDMCPKISDFGMARIFGGDETEANTRRVVGTYGYMSPEYAMDGIFSVKSDVFSFGVLVLEIVSGKRNRGVYHAAPQLNLLGYAWSLWKEGRASELVDESMGHSFPMAEALRLIVNQCDKASQCGPNGVCDPNESPICDCLKGFRPKNPSTSCRRSKCAPSPRGFHEAACVFVATYMVAEVATSPNGLGYPLLMPIRWLIIMASVLCWLLAATLVSPSIGGDTLTPGRPLADRGGTLISAGGRFELGFFSPGGSNNRYIGIWYHGIAQTVVWVANRERPVTGRAGTLFVATNGTLIITDDNSTAIWSSSSPPLADPVAQLLDDGNFVVREAGSDSEDPNSFAWRSFDFPTDTQLPGMKLGWNLTSHLNRNLSSWTSASNPAPGTYTAAIDLHGYPQLFIFSGTRKYWRGGSWNGIVFSSIPEGIYASNRFNTVVIIDAQEVMYTNYLRNPSMISRLVMNQSGKLQRFVWIEESRSWNQFWYGPKDQCDSMSPCGPNGVCYPSDWPMCHCLKGFRPKNPSKWDLRDGSDGCVRKTALDCRNGTDAFVTLNGAMIPDTSSSVVDWSLSLEQCKARCLRNCACTACASANISGSESGCIMWTTDLTDLGVVSGGLGQDLYVRLAAADIGSESGDSRRSRVVVIVAVIAMTILVLGCAACCVWKRKKRSTHETFIFWFWCQSRGACLLIRYYSTGIAGNICLAGGHNEGTGQDLDLPLFDLAAIIDATDDFSMHNKLGEGGYGPVYKGKLGGEQDVAVKRLSKTSMQGLEEFKNEVMLTAKLQHRNLVRLLGCCIQAGERMLIYEYMPNRSLDAFLFDKSEDALLDWQTRRNIIVGIARGLLYLHQDSRFRIIHRDLKASNILLDKDMNPKISDFGMARVFGGDETEANTRRVVGTYGYMSPEYAMDGIFSVKSDVFSFGVLVLEIVSGKKNRGVIYHSASHLNLLGYIWSLWKDGKGSESVDGSIRHSCSPAEVLRCTTVGLLCVQERPEDRPTMSSVVLMLSGDGELPQPRQPGFVVARAPPETGSSAANHHDSSSTRNSLSVTLLEGR